MVREDILYGLKNAVERGENVNWAARTFINAGYEINDVNEAVKELLSGGISENKLSLPDIPKRKIEVIPELPGIKREESVSVRPEKPISYPKIAQKPIPQNVLPELPSVAIISKKSVFPEVSNKSLVISIGVVGFLIIVLTVYLMSLLMA